MRTHRLVHLSDATLLRDLAALVAQERTAMAAVLAHIAEVDARKLYLPAGYPSMHAYCVGELRLSEDAAFKRIQAGRAARQFPAIFGAVAEGRLHLAAVRLLVPHLTPGNADELIAAASYQTKAEVERLIAQRFPRTEFLPLVQKIPSSPVSDFTSERANTSVAAACGSADELAPGQVSFTGTEPSGTQAQAPVARTRIKPIASDRFTVTVTFSQTAYDKLLSAQSLLSHTVPSGDVAEVLDRALNALIQQLEKQKYAATCRPRRAALPSEHPRTIPAHVRRAVRARDSGQCAFVSEDGRRCASRRGLQFDHVEPVARGGRATVENVRLLCREHNQYAAERLFGAGFMQAKRDRARHAGADAKQAALRPNVRTIPAPA